MRRRPGGRRRRRAARRSVEAAAGVARARRRRREEGVARRRGSSTTRRTACRPAPSRPRTAGAGAVGAQRRRQRARGWARSWAGRRSPGRSARPSRGGALEERERVLGVRSAASPSGSRLRSKLRRAAAIAGARRRRPWSSRAAPPSRGVDREAARVAEQVEHAPARDASVPHQRAVVALVQEQAALLPAQQVDAEAQAVLAHLRLAVGQRRRPSARAIVRRRRARRARRRRTTMSAARARAAAAARRRSGRSR